jgi:hypothetical protein
MAEDVLVDVEINHRFAIVLALTQANIVIKRVSTGRTLWAIFPHISSHTMRFFATVL